MQTKEEYDHFLKLLNEQIKSLESERAKHERSAKAYSRLVAQVEKIKARHILYHSKKGWSKPI